MTIEKIHEALESGKTVNWVNPLYELRYVNESEENEYTKPTLKNGKAIRITCVTNYFGSLLRESEFNKCFIKKD
jgi:hypothetical protein